MGKPIEFKNPGSNVSPRIKRVLTQMCSPSTLKRGAGEYGIGYEAARAEMLNALTVELGPYPWYTERQ